MHAAGPHTCGSGATAGAGPGPHHVPVSGARPSLPSRRDLLRNPLVQRRDLLRAAASAAALALLPADAHAAVWARVGSLAASAPALSPAQKAVVASLADALIPRTETPGALDVGAPAFLDVLVADYYDDTERNALAAGIDAIDALAHATAGVGFTALSGDALARVMTQLDAPPDRTVPAAQAYSRLRGVLVHGYLTSERVQKEVLKTQIMPGRWDGATPYTGRASTAGGAR